MTTEWSLNWVACHHMSYSIFAIDYSQNVLKAAAIHQCADCSKQIHKRVVNRWWSMWPSNIRAGQMWPLGKHGVSRSQINSSADRRQVLSPEYMSIIGRYLTDDWPGVLLMNVHHALPIRSYLFEVKSLEMPDFGPHPSAFQISSASPQYHFEIGGVHQVQCEHSHCKHCGTRTQQHADPHGNTQFVPWPWKTTHHIDYRSTPISS